jgi:hypothetical protein
MVNGNCEYKTVNLREHVLIPCTGSPFSSVYRFVMPLKGVCSPDKIACSVINQDAADDKIRCMVLFLKVVCSPDKRACSVINVDASDNKIR